MSLYNIYREGCFIDPVRIRCFNVDKIVPNWGYFAPCVGVLAENLEAPNRKTAIKIALQQSGVCPTCLLYNCVCQMVENF